MLRTLLTKFTTATLIASTLIVTTVHVAAVASQPTPVSITDVADRLVRPWDIAFLSPTDALVTEKEGGLQRVNLTTGQKQAIRGLPSDLDNRNQTGISDNAGLFAVVLDPDYPKNQHVYLSYSAKNPDGDGSTTKVIRARLTADALVDIKTLLVAGPYTADRYHYGGGLVFGADNKLYVTIGERLFNEKDQPVMPIAQDLQDRRGKIYRLNTDGSIPADNPVYTRQSVPGLYAVGIRAAQGLALHPVTGEIWFSEHGTRQGDELNLLAAGANFGWPVKTDGGYRHQEYQPPQLPDRKFTDPAWSWSKTVAPTGLTFYFGKEFPEWRGNILVAGLSRGSLWRAEVKDDRILNAEEIQMPQRIRLRTVKQAPDGRLYLLTDEANGRVLRLSAS